MALYQIRTLKLPSNHMSWWSLIFRRCKNRITAIWINPSGIFLSRRYKPNQHLTTPLIQDSTKLLYWPLFILPLFPIYTHMNTLAPFSIFNSEIVAKQIMEKPDAFLGEKVVVFGSKLIYCWKAGKSFFVVARGNFFGKILHLCSTVLGEIMDLLFVDINIT